MGCEVLGLRRSVAWCAPGGALEAFGAGNQQPREKLSHFPKPLLGTNAGQYTHHHDIPQLSISATARKPHSSSLSFWSIHRVLNTRSCRLSCTVPRPRDRSQESLNSNFAKTRPPSSQLLKPLRHRHHPPPSHRHLTATTAINDHPSVISPSTPIIIRDV